MAWKANVANFRTKYFVTKNLTLIFLIVETYKSPRTFARNNCRHEHLEPSSFTLFHCSIKVLSSTKLVPTVQQFGSCSDKKRWFKVVVNSNVAVECNASFLAVESGNADCTLFRRQETTTQNVSAKWLTNFWADPRTGRYLYLKLRCSLLYCSLTNDAYKEK